MRQLRYNQDSFYCRGDGNKVTLQQLSQEESLYDFHEANINMSLQIFIYTEQEEFSQKFSDIFKKQIFFYLLLACPTATSGTFLRGQPLSPNDNHQACQFCQTKVYWQPYNAVGSLSLTKHILGFVPGTFRFNAIALITHQVTLH